MHRDTVSQQSHKCKNKQKQWNIFAMAHMWRLVYLYPSGCIELLWFAPCSSKPHPSGSQENPRFRTSFCFNTQNHGQVNPSSASLAHVPIMFHLQTWIFQNTAPGKIQTILRQSRANCHPTRLCGYVESDKCCSPPWQPLGTCNGEMRSWCATLRFFWWG